MKPEAAVTEARTGSVDNLQVATFPKDLDVAAFQIGPVMTVGPMMAAGLPSGMYENPLYPIGKSDFIRSLGFCTVSVCGT
jgi:hypothetical protein